MFAVEQKCVECTIIDRNVHAQLASYRTLIVAVYKWNQYVMMMEIVQHKLPALEVHV